MEPTGAESAVVLSSEKQLELRLIGPALASSKKIPLPDAAIEAKRCWGIFAEKLSEPAASALSASFLAAGLETVVIPQSRLMALPQPLLVLNGEMTDTHWSVVGEHEAPMSIEWNKVRVIGAAGLKSTTIRKLQIKEGPTPGQKAMGMAIMMATGLPIPIGPKKRTVEKTVSETEISFLFDIVTDGPAGHFRVLADRFNYTSLKERMVHNAMGNFKQILIDVAARTPNARHARGTRILLGNQSISTMGYESLADLERECRWLFSLPLR